MSLKGVADSWASYGDLDRDDDVPDWLQDVLKDYPAPKDSSSYQQPGPASDLLDPVQAAGPPVREAKRPEPRRLNYEGHYRTPTEESILSDRPSHASEDRPLGHIEQSAQRPREIPQHVAPAGPEAGTRPYDLPVYRAPAPAPTRDAAPQAEAQAPRDVRPHPAETYADAPAASPADGVRFFDGGKEVTPSGHRPAISPRDSVARASPVVSGVTESTRMTQAPQTPPRRGTPGTPPRAGSVTKVPGSVTVPSSTFLLPDARRRDAASGTPGSTARTSRRASAEATTQTDATPACNARPDDAAPSGSRYDPRAAGDAHSGREEADGRPGDSGGAEENGMAWVAGGGEREEKEGREKGSDDAPARVSLGGDVLGDSEVDWPPELRPAAESAIHAMRRESPASQLLGSRRSFALRGSEGAAAGTEAAQGPGAGGADGGSEGRGEGATSKASSQAGTWKPMAQEVDMESALSGGTEDVEETASKRARGALPMRSGGRKGSPEEKTKQQPLTVEIDGETVTLPPGGLYAALVDVHREARVLREELYRMREETHSRVAELAEQHDRSTAAFEEEREDNRREVEELERALGAERHARQEAEERLRRVMDRAGELGVARAKALEQAKAFREAKAKADEERRALEAAHKHLVEAAAQQTSLLEEEQAKAEALKEALCARLEASKYISDFLGRPEMDRVKQTADKSISATAGTDVIAADIPQEMQETRDALVLYASELAVARYEEIRDRLLSENASCKRALERVLEELDSRAGQLALTSESEACLRGEVEVLRAECARLRAELQEAKRQAEKAGEQLSAARMERAAAEEEHREAIREAEKRLQDALKEGQERREKELREERERLEGAVEEERRWRERREGEHQAARKELEAAVQELRQRAEAAEGARERMARERDERRAEAVLLQARLQEMEGQLKAEMESAAFGQLELAAGKGELEKQLKDRNRTVHALVEQLSEVQTEKDRALQAASEARRQQKWAEQMLEDMRSVVPPEAWDLMESRLERAAEARRERMGTAPRGASAPASQ